MKKLFPILDTRFILFYIFSQNLIFIDSDVKHISKFECISPREY